MAAEVLEALMLLGFASAWPFNIARAWKAKTAVGTSPAFMIVILAAYACGMASKVLADNVTYVFAFYVLDFCLVSVALAVYFRNRGLDRRAPARGPPRAPVAQPTRSLHRFYNNEGMPKGNGILRGD